MAPFILFGKGCGRLSYHAVILFPGQHIAGRHPEWSDIVLVSPFVSRKHFMLETDGETYSITDLQSKHGTYVNDRRLEPNVPLKLDGDCRISLANSLVDMYFSPASLESTLAPVLPLFAATELPAVSPVPDEEMIVLNRRFIPLSNREYAMLYYLYKNKQEPIEMSEFKQYLSSVDEGARAEIGDDEVRRLFAELHAKVTRPVRVDR